MLSYLAPGCSLIKMVCKIVWMLPISMGKLVSS